MARSGHERGTASLAGFASTLQETLDHVQALKAAGRLILTDDGKRVRVQESLERIRAARAAGEPEVVAERTASFAGFARILGERSPSYVTQLKDEGRLVLTDDGKRVRVQESIALIKETADPAKAGVVARHASARTSEPAAPPEDDGEDAPPASPYDGHATRRSRAMADKAEWDAKAAQRDYLASIGELLPAADVEAAIAAAAITLRTSLENLPNTLAPELAAATDEARVRVILGEAIEHALEEVSRQFAAIAKADAS